MRYEEGKWLMQKLKTTALISMLNWEQDVMDKGEICFLRNGNCPR